MKFGQLFFTLFAIVSVGTNSFAKDFKLRTLPQAENPTFDMTVGEEMSYYDYVHEIIGKKMLAESGDAKNGSTNERELKAGRGISVKLGEDNYNVHINFPKRPTGGRSYGWTSGGVGDWSDKMYLEHVFKVTSQRDAADIVDFYELLIHLLGRSDPSGIDDLNKVSQRVTANFLAIYTAEQYRSMVPNPHHNWDDALLQTTFLAAFHAGQSEFKMFYTGVYTNESKKQAPGVYYRGNPGDLADKARDQEASMIDYWQFSHKIDSTQSGINITRNDFTKMGKAITAYEKAIGNSTLDKIEAIVGESNNVIQAMSKYFTDNKSELSEIAPLAKLVSKFMLEIRGHADAISASIEVKREPKKTRRMKTACVGSLSA